MNIETASHNLFILLQRMDSNVLSVGLTSIAPDVIYIYMRKGTEKRQDAPTEYEGFKVEYAIMRGMENDE